jgi:hypothetical protein
MVGVRADGRNRTNPQFIGMTTGIRVEEAKGGVHRSLAPSTDGVLT